MDRFEHEVKNQVHKKRITIARTKGNKELGETLFDPNVFVLGTSHMDSYASCHKRNTSKTL
jgi:hypothetical protein